MWPFAVFPSEVLQQIVSFLDAVEITLLDTVVDPITRGRLRNESVNHIHWSYLESDNVVSESARFTKRFIAGASWVPLCFEKYKKIESVILSSSGMKNLEDLSPSRGMLEAWGPKLVELNLNTPFLLISLFSAEYFAKYRPPLDVEHQKHMERTFNMLAEADGLKKEQASPFEPAIDLSTLSNPWLPLSTMLPNLKDLKLLMSEHKGGFFWSAAFIAEYLALLFKSLDQPNLLNFSTNLLNGYHPIILPYLPRSIKHIDITRGVTLLQLFAEDKRVGWHLNDSLLKMLPPQLESILISSGSFPTSGFDIFPHLTSISATFDHDTLALLPDRLLHLSGQFQNNLLTNSSVSKLPSHLTRLHHEGGSGKELTTAGFKNLPKSLLSLILPSSSWDDHHHLGELPPNLTRLTIGTMYHLGAMHLISRSPSPNDLRPLTCFDLMALPDSIQTLQLNASRYNMRVAQGIIPMSPLEFLSAKKFLRVLEINTPFLVDHDSFQHFPMLEKLTLFDSSAITERALISLPPRLYHIRVPIVIIDGSVSTLRMKKIENGVEGEKIDMSHRWNHKRMKEELFDWIRKSSIRAIRPLQKDMKKPFMWLRFKQHSQTVNFRMLSTTLAFHEEQRIIVDFSQNDIVSFLQQPRSTSQNKCFNIPETFEAHLRSLRPDLGNISCGKISFTDECMKMLPANMRSLIIIDGSLLTENCLQNPPFIGLRRLVLKTSKLAHLLAPFLNQFRSLSQLETLPSIKHQNKGFDFLPRSLTTLRMEIDRGNISTLIPSSCLMLLPINLCKLEILHPTELTDNSVVSLPKRLEHLHINSSLVTLNCIPLLPPNLTFIKFGVGLPTSGYLLRRYMASKK
jgi:hypothetical protein